MMALGRCLARAASSAGASENVAFDERAPAHELGMALREIVECARQETRGGERLAGMATDEAGATSDENGFHAAPCTTSLPSISNFHDGRNAKIKGSQPRGCAACCCEIFRARRRMISGK
jgi:hypothetical protein